MLLLNRYRFQDQDSGIKRKENQITNMVSYSQTYIHIFKSVFSCIFMFVHL